MKRAVLLVVAAFFATGLAACSSGSSVSSANTLNVIGGSELKDLGPILQQAQKATGVKVDLSYTGSLDGADKIASGSKSDAAWFASDKYIALAGANAKVLERKNIMLTPVILGVKRSVAQRLGWTSGNVTWRDVAQAAGQGKFKFAMTSPTASNSGFSALVGVADALANGKELSASTIDASGLKSFLDGQALTSGSSGFLVGAYEKSQDSLDGIVNYESVLVGMNQHDSLHEQLQLIYPKEGIITAQYPLMLLNSSKRDAFDKLTAYLTRPDVQAQIQTQTTRHAITPGVPKDPRLPSQVLIEASFPANLQVVQTLLDDFQTKLRRPASTVYVLDTSGSMEGDRLNNLKHAITGLTGVDTSFSGHFTRFNPREKVTLVTFSDVVSGAQSFTVDSTDPSSPTLVSLRNFVNELQANGGTAIYSALNQGYQVAEQESRDNPNSYVSIVLMTDGENNAGISSDEFLNNLRSTSANGTKIRVFSVLFGEANPDALTQIANETGGQVFDARHTNLSDVFKDIRGYQ